MTTKSKPLKAAKGGGRSQVCDLGKWIDRPPGFSAFGQAHGLGGSVWAGDGWSAHGWTVATDVPVDIGVYTTKAGAKRAVERWLSRRARTTAAKGGHKPLKSARAQETTR